MKHSNPRPHLIRAISAFSTSSQKLNKTASASIENPNDAREMRIINKPPPKNLLLKHRKLLEATISNNLYMAKSSGFVWHPNDMNVRDKRGNVPLYYATKHKNLDFVSYLIEQGAKVNERCEHGNTPFHKAFQTNIIEVLFWLSFFISCLNLDYYANVG